MKLHIWLFILLISAQSCVTRSKCAGKYPCPVITDTLIQTREKLVSITKTDTFIKGETVYVRVNCDEVKKYPKNKWVTLPGKKDSSNTVRIKADSLGNIDIECASKDLLITRLRESISVLEQKAEKKVVHAPKPRWPWWAYYLLGFGTAVLMLLLVLWSLSLLSKIRDNGNYRIG